MLQPARRNEFDDDLRWPLDLQVAGPLEPLQARLQAAGWRVQPQAKWEQALSLLDTRVEPHEVPVLPATLGARTEALLMVHDTADPGLRYVLRLWPTPQQLQPGGVPLWLGTTQAMHFKEDLGLIVAWRPQRGAESALGQVLDPLHDLPQAVAPHPQSQLPVLRLRTDLADRQEGVSPRPSTPAPGPGAGADRPPAAVPGAVRR